MARIKHEKYRGFKIEYSIVQKGFNKYNITITKYRNRNTRREEYYFKYINTYTSKLQEAKRIARKYIDNIKKIIWRSQGLSKATYLPK